MTPPGSSTKKTLSETFLSAAIIDENYIAFAFFFPPLIEKERKRERKKENESQASRDINSCQVL